ncbi:unnamed protein product, partial [Rotaria socialis]
FLRQFNAQPLWDQSALRLPIPYKLNGGLNEESIFHVSVMDILDKSLIPSCVKDLHRFFDIKRSEDLPPEREWDCQINLKPGQMPKQIKRYPMGLSDERNLQAYVEAGLKNKIICPS